MLRISETETFKPSHVRSSSNIFESNWEPTLTTNLSHLGKHNPRPQREAKNAPFNHETQAGKMQVPKRENKGDLVAGLVLCQEDSHAPI